MRKPLWQLVILLVLGAASFVAGARELRVAGTHFARIYEVTPRGDYVGLATDLLREMARRGGDTLRFDMYPWPRAQSTVEQGEADILVGPYRTPERDLRFAFMDRAFYQDQMVFYVRHDKSIGWDGSYGTLRGKRIATVRGWAYGSVFDQSRGAMKIEEVQSLERGLLMLAQDQIDLLATNERNTEGAMPRLNLSAKLHPIQPRIDVQSGYFAFPKTAAHAPLRDKYNAIFNEMVASGELARIAKRHGVRIP